MSEFEIRSDLPALAVWSAQETDRLAVLESEVRRLVREAAELRSAAAEAEQQVTQQTRNRLLALLEILDAFDRVFKSVQTKEDKVTPQMKIWLANFRAVRKLLDAIVTEEGVVRFESLDKSFDPAFHQVAETVADAGRPEGAIVDEQESGYFWRKELLRKARVLVVKNS